MNKAKYRLDKPVNEKFFLCEPHYSTFVVEPGTLVMVIPEDKEVTCQFCYSEEREKSTP